jgi:hypothetical protein
MHMSWEGPLRGRWVGEGSNAYVLGRPFEREVEGRGVWGCGGGGVACGMRNQGKMQLPSACVTDPCNSCCTIVSIAGL